MKIQGAKKVHYDSGPNMTPLVDVVMVILIFLMLAGSFGATERYLVSDVPVSQTGGNKHKQDKDVPIPTKFDLNVAQDGPFYTVTAGKFVKVTARDPAQAYNQLYGQLSAALSDYSKTVSPDEIQVTIYPTPQVTMDNLITVYQATLDAGFKKIGFGKKLGA
jgi:biopolymer transport protein ExbD